VCFCILKVQEGFDRCSLTGVQANGYEYAYPETWIRDRIRGIEVIFLLNISLSFINNFKLGQQK